MSAIKVLSKTEKRYLDIARELAEKSQLHHKHGAIVVKSGRVLGRGFNKPRNHPKIIETGRHVFECGYHAEIVAMKDAGDNVNGAVIFVARVNKEGEDLLSKPCSQCQRVLISRKVKNVIYTK